jgi:hypothetical protein
MPAFQPYWAKPAVRNDREDRGNVGIIRSPVRASILPDRNGPGCARIYCNARHTSGKKTFKWKTSGVSQQIVAQRTLATGSISECAA